MNQPSLAPLVVTFLVVIAACNKTQQASCATDVECAQEQMCLENECVDAFSALSSDPWACLRNPLPEPLDTEQLQITYADAGRGFQPVEGLDVKLCGRDDPLCEQGVIATRQTRFDGLVQFDVPGDFQGYAQATGFNYNPVISVIERVLGNQNMRTAVMFSVEQELALIAAVRQTPLAGSTTASLFVASCRCESQGFRDEGGENVEIEMIGANPEATVIYFQDGLPVLNADKTDTSGFGAAFNILPGDYRLVLTLPTQPEPTRYELNMPFRQGFRTGYVLSPAQRKDCAPDA